MVAETVSFLGRKQHDCQKKSSMEGRGRAVRGGPVASGARRSFWEGANEVRKEKQCTSVVIRLPGGIRGGMLR